MPANLSAAQRDDLARRNAEHQPTYSMVITEAEAEELAAGRVPEMVQRMAAWLCEPLEVMFGRHAAKRNAAAPKPRTKRKP